MRKAIKKGTILVVATMFLTGCGQKMATLTKSEEAIVVQYSAGTLAKHNSFQQEGVTAIYPEEEQPEQEEAVESKEAEKEESKEQSQDSKEPSQESQDKEKKDEPEVSETAGQTTLTDALAMSGIEFSYKDYSTNNTYRQGEYFSLDASAGKTFLIMNFNVTNTGTQAVDCDLLTKQPIFTLKVNQEAGVKNEVTILANDLSTYVGKLEAGQTQDTILLFEVPEKTAQNISSLQISVQINEKTHEIKLK